MLFCYKNQHTYSAMHPMWSIYIALFNMKFCQRLGVRFHPKQVLRNLKIPIFALSLKWQH